LNCRLNATSSLASDIIKSCPASAPLTPVGRLDAAEQRLDATIKAIHILRSPLERFYRALSDEQRRAFGTKRTCQSRSAMSAFGGKADISRQTLTARLDRIATGQRPHQLSQSAARTQLPRTALQPSGRRSDCLISPARLSQSRILKLVHRTPLTQEVKKFDAFAQASLHHLRATYHFADNRGNFAGAQIEAPIELFDRSEDFGVAQMRIM